LSGSFVGPFRLRSPVPPRDGHAGVPPELGRPPLRTEWRRERRAQPLCPTHTHIHIMATKTINLSEGAYTRLAALKREGESFSDVVDRITGKFAFRDLVGVLDPKKAEDLRRATKDVGKRLRKGMNRTPRR